RAGPLSLRSGAQPNINRAEPWSNAPMATTDQAPHLQQLHRMMRTIGALVSIQGITWTSSLVSVLVVPRFLGESRYGVLTTAWAVAGIVVLLASWGTTNQVVKQVAREPETARDFAAHTLALRLMIWVPLFLLTAVAGWQVSGRTTL